MYRYAYATYEMTGVLLGATIYDVIQTSGANGLMGNGVPSLPAATRALYAEALANQRLVL